MTEGLTLRPARADDGEMLWHWRNDAEVRRASLSTEEIPLPDHLAWFTRALADPDREILIALHEGQPIGMVRFDQDGDTATINILLADSHRGRGLAKPMLAAAIEGSRRGRSRLRALVRRDNAASLRLFLSLGFEVTSSGETIFLERPEGTIP